MNYSQFSNISCYEEFEIKCTLAGISKISVLYKIGHLINSESCLNDCFFFISNDGIFNWFDLEGNHIKDPHLLKELREEHIPRNITKCIIPDSVVFIDVGTFSYCRSLKEIIIPDSVAHIGSHTFWKCESLKEITIHNNVKSIGNAVFSECKSLTSITISDNIINIGDYVFSECKSLISIVIPNNVTSIGYEAFLACTSLKEIIFKGKTLKQVKQMENYPFGIKDESIIKCEK